MAITSGGMSLAAVAASPWPFLVLASVSLHFLVSRFSEFDFLKLNFLGLFSALDFGIFFFFSVNDFHCICLYLVAEKMWTKIENTNFF